MYHNSYQLLDYPQIIEILVSRYLGDLYKKWTKRNINSEQYDANTVLKYKYNYKFKETIWSKI